MTNYNAGKYSISELIALHKQRERERLVSKVLMSVLLVTFLVLGFFFAQWVIG